MGTGSTMAWRRRWLCRSQRHTGRGGTYGGTGRSGTGRSGTGRSGTGRSGTPRRHLGRSLTLVLVGAAGVVGAAVQPATAAAAAPVLAAGYYHDCEVRGGEATCWGWDADGQLGDGATATRLRPYRLGGSQGFADLDLTQISAGHLHTCAIASTGRAYCWGDNTYGQLGDGTVADRTTPVAVSTGGVLHGVKLTRIYAADTHTCALSDAGKAYCWGNNDIGQLGDGSTTNATTPVAVSTAGALAGRTLTQLATGGSHTCALASTGDAYCWGRNDRGQLGDGSTIDRTVAVAVDTGGVLAGKILSYLAAAFTHTCVISSLGAAYCWGANDAGQLGDGTTVDSATATAVATAGTLAGRKLAAISGGYGHTCAVSDAGKAYCWGNNDSGQLGDGSTAGRLTAVAATGGNLPPDAVLTQVAAGHFHTCAMSGNPVEVYCWGDNEHGQVGDGTTADRSHPAVPSWTLPPDPPRDVHGIPGDRSVTASWTEPASLGTGELVEFRATASPGGAFCVSVGPLSCTIEGLANGVSYTVTVTVSTTDGYTSPPSAPSEPVTPGLIPGRPTSVRAVPGDRSVEVSWTAPASFGSGAFVRYTAGITSNQGDASTTHAGTCETTGATRCTVTGLTNGRTYLAFVIAVSTIGPSGASDAAGPVTPGAPTLPGTVPSGNGPLGSSGGSSYAGTGATTTLSGTGFAPGTPVIIGIYSEPAVLTSTISDATGAIRVDVTVPSTYRGQHTLVARGYGAHGAGYRTLTLPITLGRTSGLAITGPVIAELVVAGVCLVAIGAAVVVGLRRRRLRPHSA